MSKSSIAFPSHYGGDRKFAKGNLVDQTQDKEAKTCRQANEDIAAKGYFIIASGTPYCVKEVVPYTIHIPHPVVVQAEATKEEFEEQLYRWNNNRSIAEITDFWQLARLYYRYYYRVTAE